MLHLFFIIIITIFTLFPIFAFGQNVEQFHECSTNLYSCGETIRSISYPFWGRDRRSHCGLPEFQLTCRDDEITTVQIIDTTFRVLDINQTTSRITIAFDDLWSELGACSLRTQSSIYSNSFEQTEFVFIPSRFMLLGLHISCLENGDDLTIADRNRVNCSGDREAGRVSFFQNVSNFVPRESCVSDVIVPVMEKQFNEFMEDETMLLTEVLKEGFPLEYRVQGGGICPRCEESGGTCWSTYNSSIASCLCSDGNSHLVVCPGSSGLNLGLKIGISLGSVLFGILIMGAGIYLCRRYKKKKRSNYGSSYMSRNILSYPSSMTDLEKDGTYNGVQIFKYKELEKATDYFDPLNELGDGGFGTVYKGKLKDGRVVAVKRLYENNYKRVEQFMNEIRILTGLHHQSLVCLYGCTTHHGRELLLVYEYIPNGTVADHLHGEKSSPGSLSWTTRMNIAIETASALVYLHHSDVVHRDVKTNNILLDNSFTVKVADFGLSRLFPDNVTHVSTAPQGTPGYVDPEYHECYQLTSKSDVYSFGVVLIELISSKPAVDITRHRHEINLSNMAINKIRNDAVHELVDPNLGFETDYEVRKMVHGVAELAFQCLQNERDCRPSMDEVLEGLKGIKNRYEKRDVLDGTSDDAVLLKNPSQMMSPDSVAIAWSTSTLSTSSG